MTHGRFSPIEPVHRMEFKVGDRVLVTDDELPHLVFGHVFKPHKSAGWYWIKEGSYGGLRPARWDMLTLLPPLKFPYSKWVPEV